MNKLYRLGFWSDSQPTINRPTGPDMNRLESSQMVDRNVELAEEILRLKSKRGAIILAHNYQRGEVQER